MEAISSAQSSHAGLQKDPLKLKPKPGRSQASSGTSSCANTLRGLGRRLPDPTPGCWGAARGWDQQRGPRAQSSLHWPGLQPAPSWPGFVIMVGFKPWAGETLGLWEVGETHSSWPP